MEYEKRCCAFVDFLGFQNFVKNKKAEEIYRVISTLSDENKISKGKAIKDLRYQAFSDNIFLSTPSDIYEMLSLIIQVTWLFMRALENGSLIRGAITVGNIYQDDDNNIVFGDALIETYHLESKVALYPRVILSKSAYRFIKSHDPDILKNYFRQSQDGIWFLHVFEEGLHLEDIEWKSTTKSVIDKLLIENIDNQRAYKKIIWFAEYYNSTLKYDVYHGANVSKDLLIKLPHWP